MGGLVGFLMAYRVDGAHPDAHFEWFSGLFVLLKKAHLAKQIHMQVHFSSLQGQKHTAKIVFLALLAVFQKLRLKKTNRQIVKNDILAVTQGAQVQSQV